MARFIIGASTERGAFRRLWARLDEIAGYPRTHQREEAGVRVARRARSLPYTESLFAGFVHDDTGPSTLHGAVALMVDDLPGGLLRRRIEVGGTTRTLSEWIQWGQANRGWEIRASLPGTESESESESESEGSAWSRVQPRDGEPGSPDGRPIPEGDE